MKVSITGGTGCLGRPLVEKLINIGAKVQLLVLPSDKGIKSLGNKIHIIYGDINSNDTLLSLTKDCEVVFHLAGKVHSVPKTEVEKQDFFHTNVDGTKNLLEAASINKVKRLVFYSTVSVYGKNSDFHGDEMSLSQPLSPYAKSKYLAEQSVLNSHQQNGVEGVVLRFPVVYGPFDRGNVASLINAIYHKLFFYFGDGNCRRSMISSINTAEAAIKAAFEPLAAQQVFCVTDDKDYSLQEIIEAICLAIKTTWRPFHIPISFAKGLGKFGDLFERLSHYSMPINSSKVAKLSRPLTFSCEKAKHVFKYKPIENLCNGINNEVEWLRRVNGWK